MIELSQRIAHFKEIAAKRHYAPEIVARILRLNPDMEEGRWLRGDDRYREKNWMAMTDVISKGAFIRERGREAWERTPRCGVVKRGKRAYMTRAAYDDSLWLLPDDHPARLINPD